MSASILTYGLLGPDKNVQKHKYGKTKCHYNFHFHQRAADTRPAPLSIHRDKTHSNKTSIGLPLRRVDGDAFERRGAKVSVH